MLTREAYKKDLLFQSFVLVPLVFSGLITLTISYDLLILGFLCLFFIGIIQTASCIYHVFIRKIDIPQSLFPVYCFLFFLINSMLAFLLIQFDVDWNPIHFCFAHYDGHVLLLQNLAISQKSDPKRASTGAFQRRYFRR